MNQINFHNLSRKDKEKLFIESEIKIQRYWWNKISDDWGEKFSFDNDTTDEWLEKHIQENIKLYDEWVNRDKRLKKFEKLVDILSSWIYGILFTVLALVIVWLLWFLNKLSIFLIVVS